MSGGSMDYIGNRLNDVVKKIPDMEIAALCKDFADLLYEIEWYTSGDTGEEDYTEAVKKFKNKWMKMPREDRLKDILLEEFETLKEKLMSTLSDTPFMDEEY